MTHNPKLAVICTLSAMALFGLIDNFMRLAAETGGLWQFHFIRSAIALALLLAAALILRLRLRPHLPGAVIGRTAFAGIAMLIYFGCLGIMPIAQAVAGLFTAPLFVVLFSVAFFQEKVGLQRSLAVVLGFVGIILVLRPDAQGLGMVTLLPILSGAFHAMGIITTRRWCAGEGAMTLLAAFFVFMLAVGAIGVVVAGAVFTNVPSGAAGYVFRGWVPFEGPFMWVTLVQGVGSLIGVGLIIKSYQLAESSFIAVFENVMIVSATLGAIVLWQEAPDSLGIAGLGCIILSGVIITIRSERAQVA